MTLLNLYDIRAAHKRIEKFVTHTPILESSLLNRWLGHQILFKAECLQRTGAFKARGASNVLAYLQENGQLPKRVIANSSGNHAQGVANAAQQFGLPATIYSTQNISKVKAQATRYYGAELKLFENRAIADEQVQRAAEDPEVFWIPPYNHPQIICGQGTAALEALEQTGEVDGVFAPCGGGGLLSGTLLATRGLIPRAEVIGAEPLNANDAAESLRSGKIQSLSGTPTTLADGAATLAVGELTFAHLRKLDGFFEIDEERIAYWTQWLQHLLKIHVEPTSAMVMEAVCRWLQGKKRPQRCLVILSGGNIDQAKMQAVWQQDYLLEPPSLAH